MKLTDFALIFVAILLPIVIIVYVNTAFVVKAEKQEMYYKNIMNSAINDAVSSMKQVENNDLDIDYGYSGIVDNKVSINSDIAIDTFYNSLSNNFNISNNAISLERLKMYIPVVAILDYDGIYIHSAEQDESGEVNFITKPKVNYTYSYVIDNNYNIQPLEDIDDLPSLNLLSKYVYQITFTMDDYVYLDIYSITIDYKIGKVSYSKKFYLSDSENNRNLVYRANILTTTKKELINQIVEHLSNKRKQVIAEIGMKEISYAVNAHNSFAKSAGINYTFRFSVESDAAWQDTMDGIGMIAIIQGVSLGSRYLNYKAYSASDLILTKKYFVSEVMHSDITVPIEMKNYTYSKLYHISSKCDVYEEYIRSLEEKTTIRTYSSRAEAATQGYYPCPVCRP